MLCRAEGISIVSGTIRNMVRHQPLRDAAPMFDLLFDRAPIWVIGPGLFLFLCIAAEAGFRLQQWLDRRLPARENTGSGAGQFLGWLLWLRSRLLWLSFFLAIHLLKAPLPLVREESNAYCTP